MLLSRAFLIRNLARCHNRSFVSVVNVKVKSMESIKVKSADIFSSSRSEEVKLTILDKDQKELDVSKLDSFKVISTQEEFHIECSEPEKYSVIIDIPLEYSPEVSLNVTAESSNVSVEDLPTGNVDVNVKTGNIYTKGLKGRTIKAETDRGDISTKGMLLGEKVSLIAKNGRVEIAKSQGDALEVDAASIKIGSCYTKNSNFHSTGDAILRNIHGNSTIKANGNKFKLSSFAGTIQAALNNKEVEIHLSELVSHNKITSTGNADIKLGLSDSILSNSNFKISSNCSIDNYADEVMVCQKRKNLFEVKKSVSRLKNNLEFNVTNGKSMEISKMSWIDFIKTI